jgi:ribosomal 30S subunit maturation factor RimM
LTRDASLWTCGILGKVHGLHGELYLNLAIGGLERLELGTDFFVAEEGAGELRPCVVTRAGGTDRRPLVRLDLAATRDEAIALQGRELLASGDALDAQPHYRVGDLIGLPVETVSGRVIGQARDVIESPAHEILVVGASGPDVLIPLVDELIGLEDGVLKVVDGLLDESAASEPPAGSGADRLGGD